MSPDQPAKLYVVPFCVTCAGACRVAVEPAATLSPEDERMRHERTVLLRPRARETLLYDAPVENAARLDRGVGRPLVDPNRPHGAVTVGGGAPSLALVRMPTLRFCPAGLEAAGNAAGERWSLSRPWGTGQARK